MRVDAISSRELDQYIYNGDAIIVDLRSKQEFQKGHIYSAINVPYEEYRQYPFPSFCPVILYCERGTNSMIVARELNRQGIKAKSLVGGIAGYRGRFLTSN